MSLKTTIKLNNGQEIPQLGFGTWQLRGDDAYNAVRLALSIGVRHIDTASIYQNEEEVGRAINDSDIPREEIFVTSKVWNNDQGFESTKQAFEESLQRLDLGYLDLYLVHWPVAETRVETYKAMEDLHEEGQAKSIGVSNFLVEHLEDLSKRTSIKPAVNQIELHTFNYQQRKDVVDRCHRNGIAIEAYSPLVQGKKFDNEVIQEIAKNHNKTPAQILLRWSLQHGNIVIPRSSSPAHIEENYEIFDIELDKDQMQKLNQLNENLVTTMNPKDF